MTRSHPELSSANSATTGAPARRAAAAPAVPTACAHWGVDEHQYFGHAVFETLLGRESLMGLHALSVLGRRLPPEDCQILEEAAVVLTMADPRIWPLKLSRAVAAYGRPIPAAAAGLLVMQDAQIGPWAVSRAAHMLSAFHARWQLAPPDRSTARVEVEQYLNQHSFLWGFGTPFRARDERLVAFERRVRARRLEQRPHFMTFEALRAAVSELREVEPNIACALAAVCLDLGFRVDQVGPLTTALTVHMFLANAVEAAAESASPLRLLDEEHIEYVGQAARTSPRAQAARTKGIAPPTRAPAPAAEGCEEWVGLDQGD